MKRSAQGRSAAFESLLTAGRTLPDVEVATKYDGSPVLKTGGKFLAGVALHESAEPDSLVVRTDIEDRHLLLEDAPETYYLTDYYRRHPVVLVRLSFVGSDVLRDILAVSWRLTRAGVMRVSRAVR